MINQGLLTSTTDKWNTPKWLLEYLYKVFEFDLDPCSDEQAHHYPNVKATYHYIVNGLERPWFGVVFMNPPYGREIAKWFRKAATCEVETVVCLVPARTDTRWWQDSIRLASFIVFIKGRLKFGDAKNSAPFPSVIVVFGEISFMQRLHLDKLGWSVTLD